MFAGLPGVGVGTLFYVLMALCMPVVELGRLVRGRSSVARWRLILRQWCFALGIVGSIMLAERILRRVLVDAASHASNPARMINQELSTRAPESLLAAPITAALLLLAAVLIAVEALRLVSALRESRREARVRDARRDPRPTVPSPRPSSRLNGSTVERDPLAAIAAE